MQPTMNAGKSGVVLLADPVRTLYRPWIISSSIAVHLPLIKISCTSPIRAPAEYRNEERNVNDTRSSCHAPPCQLCNTAPRNHESYNVVVFYGPSQAQKTLAAHGRKKQPLWEDGKLPHAVGGVNVSPSRLPSLSKSAFAIRNTQSVVQPGRATG